MDNIERCIKLLQKWHDPNSEATTLELKYLRILLSHVSQEVANTITLRIEDEQSAFLKKD